MNTQEQSEPLTELSLARHRDLEGRHWVWAPRARQLITALLVLFVVLAAGNAFGQRPSSHTSVSPAATLRVSTPAHLRGGLIFQTRVDITAHRDIAIPTVMLSGGWFDGMTLNSVQPGPAKQASAGQGATFSYPPLAAGRTMTVWFEWSVNPTNLAWQRPTLTDISDGGTTLVAQRSTVTVFP
jgi:hypothetical protein